MPCRSPCWHPTHRVARRFGVSSIKWQMHTLITAQMPCALLLPICWVLSVFNHDFGVLLQDIGPRYAGVLLGMSNTAGSRVALSHPAVHALFPLFMRLATFYMRHSCFPTCCFMSDQMRSRTCAACHRRAGRSVWHRSHRLHPEARHLGRGVGRGSGAVPCRSRSLERLQHRCGVRL
jgi:hypothetical protein